LSIQQDRTRVTRLKTSFKHSEKVSVGFIHRPRIHYISFTRVLSICKKKRKVIKEGLAMITVSL